MDASKIEKEASKIKKAVCGIVHHVDFGSCLSVVVKGYI
jgi:hypothetical protein